MISLVLSLCAISDSLQGRSATPTFNQYPATELVHAKLAIPKLITQEEKQFRTVLRQAVLNGYGVVDGGTEHERVGANFAGHYVLVQWGCGVNCLEAAVIDGISGRVRTIPRPPGMQRSGFELSTDGSNLRSLQFRRNSKLLGIPCVTDHMTYYYVLGVNGWKFLSRK